MTPRERLTAAKYETMDAMIQAYAAEAVRTARSDFRETLDFRLHSLERLEAILNRLCPAPDPLPPADGDWLEVGGAATGAGSRLYPMMKVHRRLSLGSGESLPAFYALVAERLAAAAGSDQPASPQGVNPHGAN